MTDRQRDIFLGCLPLLLGVDLLAAIVFLPIALRGNADFRQFYTGGYMLRVGYRHQLYDYDLQSTIGHSPIPSVHPAYEYLPFALLSFLPYQAAYFAWMVINGGLLFASFCILRSQFAGPFWLLAGVGLAFVPVWATLLHGQDSIVLLVLLSLAHRSNRDLRSGLWLGAGVFKFHIVVPIALLYFLWRKRRVVGGFCISGGAATILSVALVGIRGSIHYALTAPSMAAMQLHAGAMPNLYHLVIAIAGHGRVAIAVTVLLAIALLAWATRQRPSMQTAILAVPVLSFYLLGHDLTILLLPIVSGALWFPWVGAAFIFLPGYAYIASLPVLATILKSAKEPEASRIEGERRERYDRCHST